MTVEQQTQQVPFSSFGLHVDLVRAVDDLGFIKPTPIQADAIPPALDGRDLLACAMTGSGKTAAFLLPILHQLQSKPRRATRVLILSPTRELAAQIHEHLTELARHTPLHGAAVYGGVAMRPQEKAFRRGVDVIVATPGRLLDHFQYPYAQLKDLEFLVLDEADRMLDMGFLPDIRRVLRHLPNRPRQTMCFSATMPQPIIDLTREMLKEPATVNLERKQAPATGITQSLYQVPQHLKADLLKELVQRGEIRSAIVFCRTKHRADRLARKIQRHGIETARIHGNRSQSQRTEALAGFKSGRYHVLVATDIVARGIDVTALGHVVNFDVPNMPDDYIHRVGRTARAELTGDAVTFVSPEEEKLVREIERSLGKRIERRKVQGFDYAQKPKERLEVPRSERIAAIRARRAQDRARGQAKGKQVQGANPHDHQKAGKAPAGPGGRSRRRRRPAARQPVDSSGQRRS